MAAGSHHRTVALAAHPGRRESAEMRRARESSCFANQLNDGPRTQELGELLLILVAQHWPSTWTSTVRHRPDVDDWFAPPTPAADQMIRVLRPALAFLRPPQMSNRCVAGQGVLEHSCRTSQPCKSLLGLTRGSRPSPGKSASGSVAHSAGPAIGPTIRTAAEVPRRRLASGTAPVRSQNCVMMR